MLKWFILTGSLTKSIIILAQCTIQIQTIKFFFQKNKKQRSIELYLKNS
jgi:hypothetical protein